MKIISKFINVKNIPVVLDLFAIYRFKSLMMIHML